ncbi:hypothetical protein B0H19DRAFT_1086103 [Mycena capillaripes]|nr:hypothetical protein B0H19DRAFT_1086103 [Mycena capillaripes]
MLGRLPGFSHPTAPKASQISQAIDATELPEHAIFSLISPQSYSDLRSHTPTSSHRRRRSQWLGFLRNFVGRGQFVAPERGGDIGGVWYLPQSGSPYASILSLSRSSCARRQGFGGIFLLLAANPDVESYSSSMNAEAIPGSLPAPLEGEKGRLDKWSDEDWMNREEIYKCKWAKLMAEAEAEKLRRHVYFGFASLLVKGFFGCGITFQQTPCNGRAIQQDAFPTEGVLDAVDSNFSVHEGWSGGELGADYNNDWVHTLFYQGVTPQFCNLIDNAPPVIIPIYATELWNNTALIFSDELDGLFASEFERDKGKSDADAVAIVGVAWKWKSAVVAGSVAGWGLKRGAVAVCGLPAFSPDHASSPMALPFTPCNEAEMAATPELRSFRASQVRPMPMASVSI